MGAMKSTWPIVRNNRLPPPITGSELDYFLRPPTMTTLEQDFSWFGGFGDSWQTNEPGSDVELRILKHAWYVLGLSQRSVNLVRNPILSKLSGRRERAIFP